MSNTKHTQGPWRLDTINAGHVMAENDTINGKGWDYKKVSVKSGETIIGEVTAMKTHVFLHDFDEFDANAKLIAAAPDLLEALQGILPLAELVCSKCVPNDMDLTPFDLARNAIKKATT